jgi:UDP-N-acetylmuramoyl-tripeptide--D-alanyl-D-alanine ligase
MRAAIDLLAQAAPRRTAILGAMRELGPSSAAQHRDLGAYAKAAGIERFWGVGDALLPAVDAFGAGGQFFADRAALLPHLATEVDGDDTLLVKGSRGAAMEHIVQALLDGGED